MSVIALSLPAILILRKVLKDTDIKRILHAREQG